MNQLQILNGAILLLSIANVLLAFEYLRLKTIVRLTTKDLIAMQLYLTEQKLNNDRLIANCERLHAECKRILAALAAQNKS